MNVYRPDEIRNPFEAMVAALSGPEPQFDSITEHLLLESYWQVKQRCRRGGLLDVACFGTAVPWVYCLTFRTRGLMGTGLQGDVRKCSRFVVAIRFLSDYLRRADRFEMLRLLTPPRSPPPFHPNLSPDGRICVEIYPGESLLEIAESLHDLFRWRLRNTDESDSLNAVACAWGRDNVSRPLDDRPLFGRRLNIRLETIDGKQSS